VAAGSLRQTPGSRRSSSRSNRGEKGQAEDVVGEGGGPEKRRDAEAAGFTGGREGGARRHPASPEAEEEGAAVGAIPVSASSPSRVTGKRFGPQASNATECRAVDWFIRERAA
jgi:hypothetical protein